MAGKKTVTWSVKVNLGNYESLGLEVSGEVETADESMDLAGFMAGQLLGLDAEPVTAEAIQKLVSRTFGIRVEDLPKGPRKEDPSIYESKPRPAPSTPAAATLNQVSPLPERMPAPTPAAAPATPAPAPAAPAAKPVPAAPAKPAVATCSKCGAGVTESQKKMSQLFASKTLCKKCLDGGAF